MESEHSKSSTLRLFSYVICINIAGLTLGTAIGWTSPMIPKLEYKHSDSPLDHKIDMHEKGWIFSLIAIGAGFSAYIAGPVADKLGRKKALTLASCLFTIAYSVMFVATSVRQIYAARILQGTGCGTAMTVIPMYVGELAPKQQRGSAGSLMMLCMTLGMLYVYCLGPFTPYKTFQLLCLALPLVSFVGYFFVPESPYYLIGHDRIDDAVYSLQTLRGKSAESVQNEIEEILAAVTRAKSATKGSCKDVVHNRGNRKAWITVVGIMLCQQFSGVVIIVVNAQSVFIEAKTIIDPAYATILVGITQVIFSFMLQLIVDRWNRRLLLKISATGMCAAQFATGTFFYFKSQGCSSPVMTWIPLVAFIIFQIAYRLGFGPLPFAILGEMVPPNIRSLTAGSVTIVCWGFGFLIGRLYPVVNEMGPHFVFLFFSCCCALAFLFVHFYVIETRGLSFTEIQDLLDA